MAYPVYTIDPYALTSVAAVKEHLNIPDANTTQDNIITRMVNSASQMIETYLDRKILRRQYTEYYDGRGNDRFLVREWPVEKPTELWLDSTSTFTDVTKKYDLDEYEVDGEPAIGVTLLSGRRFAKGTRNIKVIYYAGYTVTPAVIHEAAILFTEFMYDMKTDRRIGVSSKGKNAESTTFLGDLPDFVKNMLAPYQRMEFPSSHVGVQNF